MIYFINQQTDPYYNLAVEEALLKSDIDEEILLLWQNYNTIVVGRNQNTIEEINLQQTEKDGVRIVRRLSGGGAVFHDWGNLNFTFIRNSDQLRNYEAILKPVISTLQKLGLKATFAGKNDIEIEGKKISGNAQYIYKHRLLHHGTILFDADFTKMGRYLNVDSTKIKSKGIKSIPARMVNIKSLLSSDLTIDEFKKYIVKELVKDNAKIMDLPQSIIADAEKFAEEKYRQWSWNFGNSPDFTYENKVRFENKGTIEVKIDVQRGVIKTAAFYGDFLGSLGTENAAVKLKGCLYTKTAIENVLMTLDYRGIFGEAFTLEEILSVMLAAR